VLYSLFNKLNPQYKTDWSKHNCQCNGIFEFMEFNLHYKVSPSKHQNCRYNPLSTGRWEPLSDKGVISSKSGSGWSSDVLRVLYVISCTCSECIVRVHVRANTIFSVRILSARSLVLAHESFVSLSCLWYWYSCFLEPTNA